MPSPSFLPVHLRLPSSNLKSRKTTDEKSRSREEKTTRLSHKTNDEKWRRDSSRLAVPAGASNWHCCCCVSCCCYCCWFGFFLVFVRACDVMSMCGVGGMEGGGGGWFMIGRMVEGVGRRVQLGAHRKCTHSNTKNGGGIIFTQQTRSIQRASGISSRTWGGGQTQHCNSTQCKPYMLYANVLLALSLSLSR